MCVIFGTHFSFYIRDRGRKLKEANLALLSDLNRNIYNLSSRQEKSILASKNSIRDQNKKSITLLS